jgi:hypothetical protein
MAITIQQQPYDMVLSGQKLIFNLSSTNVAQTGFKYIMYITVGGETIGPMNFQPNPFNRGIIDIREIIEPLCTHRIAPLGSEDSLMQTGASQSYSFKNEDPTSDTTLRKVDFEFFEGWIDAGVFTEDPDTLGAVTATLYIADGFAQATNGYRQLAMDSAVWLTDKPGDETYWYWYELLEKYAGPSANFTNPRVFVVRDFDYGVLSVVTDDGTATSGGAASFRLYCEVVDSSGVSHVGYDTITSDAGQLTHVGCFPGNFFANTSGLENPWDYSGFRYYRIWIATSMGVQVSSDMIFLPADDYDSTCRTNPILRLSWANSQGGWDHWSFTNPSQKSYQYERRRFTQVLGTYGEQAFTFVKYDRGLTEAGIVSPQFIDVSSGWLNEADFAYLQSLMRSKQVYVNMLDDLPSMGSNTIGTTTACVIEASDYLQRRERKSKMYNQAIRIRLANNQWT